MPQIVEKISEDSEVDVEVCLELILHLKMISSPYSLRTLSTLVFINIISSHSVECKSML